MKPFLTYFLALWLLTLIFSCSGKKENIAVESNVPLKAITVYGSTECDHCIQFLAQLDSSNVNYTFKDLKIIERKYDEEMLMKIQQANYKGYIHLPVVEVGDSIMIRPNISDVIGFM